MFASYEFGSSEVTSVLLNLAPGEYVGSVFWTPLNPETWPVDATFVLAAASGTPFNADDFEVTSSSTSVLPATSFLQRVRLVVGLRPVSLAMAGTFDPEAPVEGAYVMVNLSKIG